MDASVHSLALLLGALLLLAAPSVAHSQDSDLMWTAMQGHEVVLSLQSGMEARGTVVGVDDTHVVLQKSDGMILTVLRADVTKVVEAETAEAGPAPASTPAPAPASTPAPASPPAATPPAAEEEQLRQWTRQVDRPTAILQGLGLGLSGGGLGVAGAGWGIAAVDYYEEDLPGNPTCTVHQGSGNLICDVNPAFMGMVGVGAGLFASSTVMNAMAASRVHKGLKGRGLRAPTTWSVIGTILQGLGTAAVATGIGLWASDEAVDPGHLTAGGGLVFVLAGQSILFFDIQNKRRWGREGRGKIRKRDR
jgi:hypothetical protein